ncbi:MAG: MqnA/MqnD/SBP family protein [Opitutales bacterium]
MKLNFAITPCPNDVFSYWALLENKIENFFEFSFGDIEELNKDAWLALPEITKLSFAAYLNLREHYTLLNVGAALGKGTGPVLIARDENVDLASAKIAIAGVDTTSNLLLKFYAKKTLGDDVILSTIPMHFRSILDALKAGEVDCAVLIHEGRFVYETLGFKLLSDLGGFWEKETSLPVPLGCICIHNDLIEQKKEVEEKIYSSIKYAFENPEKTLPLVKKYADYLDDDVLRKHIYAFVNEYSLDISEIKDKLIETLELAR